jgi:hypothetical protein
MSRVKVLATLATAAGAALFAASALPAGELTAGLLATSGAGFCEVASAGMVPGESVPADICPEVRGSLADGFPMVSDLAEVEGGAGAATGTGTGVLVEDCCGETIDIAA